MRKIFRDIKETKKIDFIPNIWRALANHPEHLELCWTRLKVIMAPGKVDALTKEIVALAVSATNGCNYCINSHTAATQKLGLTLEQLGAMQQSGKVKAGGVFIGPLGVCFIVDCDSNDDLHLTLTTLPAFRFATWDATPLIPFHRDIEMSLDDALTRAKETG